jgi:alpha-L-fucosidase
LRTVTVLRAGLAALLASSALALAAPAAAAQAPSAAARASEAPYIPSADNLAARQWYQDAKFGVFIHWGLYSLLAGGGEKNGLAEWIMNEKKIPIAQYERLADFFNPVKFNADEWVSQIKASGARYITITSKHHDGFALWDSQVSDWDVMRTPFKRDILGELKAACDRQGVKLFFYHSQLDWHHPDYFPRGKTGKGYTGRPEAGNWDRYIDYQNAQLTELITRYQPAGFWFDGWWDHEETPMRDRWRLRETYDLIHKLSPAALIGNNHHVTPFPGEDYQMFEQDLPGENEKGFNKAEVSRLPLEMADTMNGTWGYSLTDASPKTTKQLIHRLVGSAGRNANYLMNTGPMPDGRLQPENVETFKEIGAFMRANGESIYGTRAGPVKPQPWGVTTAKAGRVYVHVLNMPADGVVNVPLKGVRGASLLDGGAPVKMTRTADGVRLNLSADRAGPYDTVVVLRTR